MEPSQCLKKNSLPSSVPCLTAGADCSESLRFDIFVSAVPQELLHEPMRLHLPQDGMWEQMNTKAITYFSLIPDPETTLGLSIEPAKENLASRIGWRISYFSWVKVTAYPRDDRFDAAMS